jgi:hypothetical protein
MRMILPSHVNALVLIVSLIGGSVMAAEDYRHPVAVIPFATIKPTIDGTVDDGEWQGAFSQRALQTTGKAVSSRQARFFMMWDEENIYVAMRDQLRPGERPLQASGERSTRLACLTAQDDRRSRSETIGFAVFTALSTDKAIWPTQIFQKRCASSIIWENALKLGEGCREAALIHSTLYNKRLRSCQSTV